MISARRHMIRIELKRRTQVDKIFKWKSIWNGGRNGRARDEFQWAAPRNDAEET